MSQSRLTLAVEENGLVLPGDGRVAVFFPRADTDLSALPRDRVEVVQPFWPDHDAFLRAGLNCVLGEEGSYAGALVCLPRSKAQARDLIARAAESADLVIVDGQKTDGADSLLRECRKRTDVLGVLSKSHGKLFWFRGGEFADWHAPRTMTIEGGFVTSAGVFSADGIDPGSRALAAVLPEKLGRIVADLGAGWGYLSAEILKRESVETLYLVEADREALDCAEQNITDPRAAFHWADATRWEPRARMDSVVMNPPFHTSRSAEPALGIAFIEAAARMLAPAGQLWLVANRHLPYETALKARFARVEEVAGDNRFKILHASRPARTKG